MPRLSFNGPIYHIKKHPVVSAVNLIDIIIVYRWREVASVVFVEIETSSVHVLSKIIYQSLE